MRWRLAAILLAALLVGCRTGAGSLPDQVTPGPHEGLDAVLWMQTSAEYRISAEQAYRLAMLRLEDALRPENAGWTAAVEQKPGYAGLPPAVILDVDDTVLASTPFQAQLVREQARFEPEAWSAWVRKEEAPAVPGSLALARSARERGVRIFYITNRELDLEEATRRNLERQGFPVEGGGDSILSRGERPGWDLKLPRREFVASSHRVLLIVGDSLDDFVAGSRAAAEERNALAQRYDDYWGTRWILIPNPVYGDWLRSLDGFGHAPPPGEILRRKQELLEPYD